jgi:EamA domain-containing membrane protein RarD
MPRLVTYRAVYYLLPLAVAMIGLVIDEVRQRRSQVAAVATTFATLGRLTELITRVCCRWSRSWEARFC